MEKQVIVFASDRYKPFFGGVENSFYNLSKSAINLGYNPLIFVSNLSPNKREKLPRESYDSGIKIRRFHLIKYPFFLFFLQPFFLIYSAFIGFKRLKKDLGSNTIIVTRNHYISYASSLAKFKNVVYLIPSVVKGLDDRKVASGSLANKLKELLIHKTNIRISSKIQKRAIIKAKHCLVFSQNMKKQVDYILKSNMEIKEITIVEPGVDFNQFLVDSELRESNRKQLKLDSYFVFLCLGRIIEAKGFSDVLYAYKMLDDNMQRKAKVLIVGDGPEKANLLLIVEKLDLMSQVHFFDATPTPSLYYSISDCFMMTSRYEAFGQTIIEAMASGLPVIGYKSGSKEILTATNEIVSNSENGFLCDFGIKHLTGSMKMVLEQSPAKLEEMKAYNIETIKNRYSWDNLLLSIIDLFN